MMGKKRRTQYPLDHPLSDKIDIMVEESKKKKNDEEESDFVRFYHQGRYEGLKEVQDEIFELEDDYAIDRDNKADEDRHSGYGRGDLMG